MGYRLQVKLHHPERNVIKNTQRDQAIQAILEVHLLTHVAFRELKN